MDGKPPKIDDDVIDPDKEIPAFGRAYRRMLDAQREEEMMKENPDSEIGLPDRPEKRIKEKFRKDRENIERRLNARGDSLYKSKREEMQNPWAGAPGVGWGGQQSSPWPGWPGPAQNNSFGGWGGGYGTPDQESPFGRNNQEDENQVENDGEDSFDKDAFGSISDSKNDIDDEYNSDMEDDSDNEDDGDNESMSGEESAFQKAGKAFAKGKSPEFNEEFYDDNEAGDISDEDDFGKGPLSTKSQYNEGESEREAYDDSTAVMKGNAEAQEEYSDLESDSEENTSTDPNLDPYGRPKKKLKEKFMKDREDLEKLMNAKGDSIYRKASEPPPGANPPPDGGKGPPPGYPERPRILGPDELRAQMALAKIARAAMKVASKRKGRKGKASIVFI